MSKRRTLQRAANPAPKPKPAETESAEAETPVEETSPEAEAGSQESDGVDHRGEAEAAPEAQPDDPVENDDDPEFESAEPLVDGPAWIEQMRSKAKSEPEHEAVKEPENGLIDFGSMVGELGFRMPVYHTSAVDRLVRDCPPNDAVSNRERDILRAAFSAISEVAGNPDSVAFEAFLTTHEGAENFPLTFTVAPRAGNGEIPWVGVIDTDENPVEQH